MGYSCTTNFVCCVVLCGFGFVTLSHGRRLYVCMGIITAMHVALAFDVVLVAAIVISIYLLTAILRI